MSDHELALGRQAYLDSLNLSEGVNFLRWEVGDHLPNDVKTPHHIGTVAIVGTRWERLGEIYVVEKTNKAIFINRESVEDQRTFSNIYRMTGETCKQQLSARGEEIESDEPDDEDAVVAKTAEEMIGQGVITLGGFSVIEFKEGPKTKYSKTFFCAEVLAQNLALSLRSAVVDTDTSVFEKQAATKEEKMFAKLAILAIHHAKTMNENLVDFLGQQFTLRNLPDPKDLRKHLGFAPPTRKRE